MTIPQALTAACDEHRAGRLPQAEKLYRQILAMQPDNADALNLLGVIAYQTGHHPAAIELISRAISIHSATPDYHHNLGLALRQNNDLQAAITAFRQAIALKDDHLDAHANLAACLKKTNQVAESLPHYRRVCDARPDDAKALVNYGDALMKTHQYSEAADAFRRASEVDPAQPEAQNNLGNALRYQGKIEEAVAAYEKAISLRPNFAEAWNNLGNAYRTQRKLAESVEAHKKAITIKPDYAKAIYNLSGTMTDLGQHDAAIAGFNRVLELNPDDVPTLMSIGNIYKDEGNLPEAVRCYERASAADPDDIRPASNRAYVLNFHPDFDGPAILRELRKWSDHFARPYYPANLEFPHDRSPDRRLRVGYVSPDFRDHVVGRNILPLVREHDRSQFEVVLYSNVRRPDEFTEKFRSMADQWHEISRFPDRLVAEKIREHQVDILVDLTLHMSHGRLRVFANKPAPIEVTFGGYPGGTGVDSIDYRLSDPYLDPIDATEYSHVERCVRLPDTFWCYDRQGMELSDDLQPSPLPARSAGHVTFGCLNNFCKVNDGVLDLWARVLAAVPHSRLTLLNPNGPHRKVIIDIMALHGVSSDRLEFVNRKNRDDYLAVYNNIDISLDTVPYNGHTTSLDSFWMGAPVVTLIGKTVVGRAGWSQLSNLNLRHLAATTPDQFISIATNLAADLPALADLRAGMRHRMLQSPLCDPKKFTRGIESAYRQMWRDWAAR